MSSRIWLYQTNRPLNQEEQNKLREKLEIFAQNWQAHGKSLHANFWFHNPYLLICEVDEQIWSASGCSIDSKVHFLKQLGNDFQIDFFVRMKTIIRTQTGEFMQMDFKEVKNLQTPYQVFNPTISNTKELGAIFTAKDDSPLKHLFD